MFEIILTCKIDELQANAQQFYELLKNEKEAEELICILWKRVPELTDKEEKKLHKLGRKIRKKFNMKPIVI